MKAAGFALACIVIGGGIAAGYFAADRDVLDHLPFDLSLGKESGSSESKTYPTANRDNKDNRVAAGGALDPTAETSPLPRTDRLRQSYAATDPVNALPLPQPEAAPLPRPRPRTIRRQQSSYTLLSDLQIEAIKARLKLTPAQQQLWPPVEATLRKLAVKLHEGKRTGDPSLAPDSPEIAELKQAAAPLMAQLNADQKRDLRALAHIIGLAPVVAQL